MVQVIAISLREIFRDRIFHGIIVTALLFFLIPSVSVLSMRQVTELSITFSLSLISFILMLLAVFLGGTSLWRDIDRHYVHSVLGLPLSRASYLIGRFAANALFLLICCCLLAVVAYVVIAYSSMMYPPSRPVQWATIALAVFFDALKYILLIGVGFLFSTLSTSFFLPVFGTIVIYMVGSASQEVFDYLHSPAVSKTIPLFVVKAASGLYYILPNLSSFEFKLHAVYGLEVLPRGLILTVGYFVIYTALLLTASAILFSHRDM